MSLPRTPLGMLGIFGVVHLPAMPGDPLADDTTFAEVREYALRDAEALAEGGVDGLVVENFGSAPFPKGSPGHRVQPHQVAQITAVVLEIKARFDLKIGVNCLRNDVMSALGIAAVTDAAFVRVNVHVGAYVTDQGLIEGEAHRSLRYRQTLGARSVAILADVLVKHATPLAPVEPEDAVADTLKRGHADGVIVAGSATGAAVDPELLQRVRSACGSSPVFIGSGLCMDNAATLAPLADGAIIGTAFKSDANVAAPVDAQRVRSLCARVRDHLR